MAWLLALLAPAVLGFPWVLALRELLPAVPVASLAGLVCALLGLTASATDLLWHRIPNWATYPAGLWGLTLALAGLLPGPEPLLASLGSPGLLGGILGFLACLVGMVLIAQLAGGGIGDVKMGAVLGLLLGPERGLFALTVAFLAAGLFALSWAVWKFGPLGILVLLGRRLYAAMRGLPPVPLTEEQQQFLKIPLPLAPFMTLGVFFVLFGGPSPW